MSDVDLFYFNVALLQPSNVDFLLLNNAHLKKKSHLVLRFHRSLGGRDLSEVFDNAEDDDHVM